jgi:hypothetical protein
MSSASENTSLTRSGSDSGIKTIPTISSGTALADNTWGFSKDNGSTYNAIPALANPATIIDTTSATTTAANLATGSAVIAAIAAAADGMDDDEVPQSERYLFITPTLLGLVRDLDTTKSKAVLDQFAGVVKVPQTRFYTAIDQNDGTTSGEEAGGYAKASGAKNINFMIIHKPALIQFEKHVAPKIVTPEQNQSADAWKFGYRNVSIADVYDNKVKGIYLHKAES